MPDARAFLEDKQLDELRPHLISLDNGRLSDKGMLANSEEEIRHNISSKFRETTKNWKKKRLVLYAHGGLVPEKSGLNDIYEDFQEMMDNECYPLAFIWHTGLFETLSDMLSDLKKQYEESKTDSWGLDGILDSLDSWLEDRGRELGSLIWGAMKDNAKQATIASNGGARFVASLITEIIQEDGEIQLHMIGHSAGSILLAYMVDFLSQETISAEHGLTISSCSLWAPACTMDLFETSYLPALEASKIKALNLYTLTDRKEQSDNCMFIYNKSLLYLVSNSFEGDASRSVPLLGMARFVEGHKQIASMIDSSLLNWIKTGEPESFKECQKHGDFPDRDKDVVKHTIRLISESI